MRYTLHRQRPYEPRTLRRVIPIAQARTVELITVTVLSLEEFADGCRVRALITLALDHPFVAAERRRAERWQRLMHEALERGEDLRRVTEGERERHVRRPDFWFEVFDDRDVRYRSRPAGWSSNGGAVWECSFEFEPAIDPAAQSLHLVMEAVRWSDMEWGAGSDLEQRLDTGPWQFAVRVGGSAGQAVTELT